MGYTEKIGGLPHRPPAGFVSYATSDPIYGQEVRVHKSPGETTSLGAAIAAGVGVGLFESYEQAAQMVKTRSSHAVNPAWREAYAQMYPLYTMIYERMRPITDRLAALRS